ncbi:5-oxoprolinase [Maudiozyma humilis]|uniref:5-oxoprolinase n=1 Tax=Maudiozyma humilis TaxID=51915 RepID=A0AAV5S368_MAUHU|nr:5-oxoprolinase [Kazachstania humilis]
MSNARTVDAGCRYSIAIDRGGTFTDVIANRGSGRAEDDVVFKLLSVDPKNYKDAPLEGIRRVLEIFEGKPIPRGEPLDISNVASIRMGTTLATNCALERNGEPCAFLTTKGFRDALVIGDQTRPDIFDLNIRKSKPLYQLVEEIDERVTLEDYSEQSPFIKSAANDEEAKFEGKSGEIVRVIKTPDETEVRKVLNAIYNKGIRSIAVAFMHSYTYPDHEKLVGRIAKEVGFTHISLSSVVSTMIKYLPRAHSSVADAYLTPVIKKYLDSISAGLTNAENTSIQFMQSDGGLVEGNKFSGLRSILSGPAGGVVGYSRTCYDNKQKTALIGFDMGGTSTDISRYGNGKLEHIFETTTAGIIIQSPQLDISTVAAGGSSILSWENGLFKVGPRSATADPGPAAYRKGGPLTITDANLFLGRLVPQLFPHIFGPNEDQPLDLEATTRLFEELTQRINKDLNANMTPQEVASGFIEVANEGIARPIRALTEAKGFDVSKHDLVSFGGAGGQHAVSVAEALGINKVIIHRYSSILSAYGIYLADVVEEHQEPCSIVLSEVDAKQNIEHTFHRLISKSNIELEKQGFNKDAIAIEKYLNLRYEGTETALMIHQKDERWNFVSDFTDNHKREFGFAFPDKNIIVDDVRVRCIGKSEIMTQQSISDPLASLPAVKTIPQSDFTQEVYFKQGYAKTPVYTIDRMTAGTVITGPAILADTTQTNVIPENAKATILKSHILVEVLDRTVVQENPDGSDIDPILLSIFGHRFMDIAEQMGTQLRKTSVSTNVKERLDFSCALFDPEGNLVANAPHVPVHLGSMSTCIMAQAKLWRNRLKPGMVIFTNHPDVGGTHLPDITVITPSFSEDCQLLFYVASRAHHADIGGILPGSVPPDSKELYEEGAAIYSELLVEDGIFQEDLVYDLFVTKPSQFPGCSGARRISDNISDLKAQVAANTKGIQLINSLVGEYHYPLILKYMNAIQDNAASTIKAMLHKLCEHFGQTTFIGEDYMDDGSHICLTVNLDLLNDKYTFDFTGTSPQVYGNTNAPTAITNSAILYSLRCLVGEEIPLNQGCLSPITIKIPDGSILSPCNGVAVVGGNVLTSQRVTDVILKTLHVQADSQGDCNNFTFGTGGGTDPQTGAHYDGFGYYETICGGSGAGCDSWRGPGWNGTAAVHTNMTNTRMTDTEVFERRYPVILRRFCVRQGSGGRGKYHGGDGVIRDVEFRLPLQASVLSERRVTAPHGLSGGEDGVRGQNSWIRLHNGTVTNIGGKNTVSVSPGDRIIIETPGGGAFGPMPRI